MAPRDSAYRRAPTQERSRFTVDAIFEAAGKLLDDAGLERATTARIAHVAGVSVGSLYQYFPRKEALFGALTERAMERDLVRVRAAVDDAREMPVDAGIRHVMGAALSFAREQPRLFCWMLRYLPALGLTPAVEAFERALAAELRRFLDDHRAELAPGDPELHALLGLGAVRGALVVVARERPSAIEDGTAFELAHELVLAVLSVRRAGDVSVER